MPRKLRDDVVQIINILKYRDALGGFKLVPIENRTEREVAEIMKESLIFLSFSYQEGCALPPMEAMACGCLVIGYDGRGGREYFDNTFSYPIERGDIISFAKTIGEVISRYNKDHNIFDEERQRDSEYIKKNYSTKRETEDVLQCWRKIITEYSSQYEKEQDVFRPFNKHGDEGLISGKFLAYYYGFRDKIFPARTIRRKIAKAIYLLFFDWNKFKENLKTFFHLWKQGGLKAIFPKATPESNISTAEEKKKDKQTFPFPESALAHKYCVGKGLEIGGSAHNPYGLNTLNVDFTDSMETKFKKEEIRLCGKALKVDIVAPGDDIQLPDESQDFIVSSHVIEHFTNPIKALIEWDRLVKPDGIIFMIVPHKERTFDKERENTPLQHVIEDFRNNTTQSNGDPKGHEHVWVTETFVELIKYMIEKLRMKWEIVEVQDVDDKVGNGFTVVIRKIKTHKFMEHAQ